jgi:hypothetical protein
MAAAIPDLEDDTLLAIDILDIANLPRFRLS